MTILAVPGEFGLDEYIVCPHGPIGSLRERMLQRAKVVEGSYAHDLVDQLHRAIFIQSLDVKGDFQTYFNSEYPAFEEYLHRRERLPCNVAAALASDFEACTGMYRFRPRYSRHSFLSDASGIQLLSDLLEDPMEREEAI
jgi:hypothetical protein